MPASRRRSIISVRNSLCSVTFNPQLDYRTECRTVCRHGKCHKHCGDTHRDRIPRTGGVVHVGTVHERRLHHDTPRYSAYNQHIHIYRTLHVSFRPKYRASAIMACPMDTSLRYGTFSWKYLRLARFRSWPALTPRPQLWAALLASTYGYQQSSYTPQRPRRECARCGACCS